MFEAKTRFVHWPKQLAVIMVAAGATLAGLVPMTLEDFHLSGTQIGDVPVSNITTSATTPTRSR
jgi:hypothetical protein